MKIKSVFGFCSYKGCRARHRFDVELKAGTIKKKVKLCGYHATQLCKNGILKSVTYK